MPIVMALGSCDFAYIRIHRRTGKHRVLSDGEIKRYGAEATDRLVIVIRFPLKCPGTFSCEFELDIIISTYRCVPFLPL